MSTKVTSEWLLLSDQQPPEVLLRQNITFDAPNYGTVTRIHSMEREVRLHAGDGRLKSVVVTLKDDAASTVALLTISPK